MATQAELNQAQLLYVAYYGRPADPAGLEFWAEQIAQVGVAGIAADFGNSAEFEAEFGSLGSVALINNLYQQLFGRDAEAEGLQYWLDVLAEGTPLASIALEIANGAQGGDATGLQNKVTLANQFTALVASGDVSYDGADAAAYGRAFLATINENTNVANYDVQAVVDGIASGVLPADTADLRSALEELRNAEDAVETFLEDARSNELLQENQSVDAETDLGIVRTAITNEYDTAAAALATSTGATNFATRTPATQDALIAEAVANAESDVADFEARIANVEGLAEAIAALRAAQEADTAAQEALTEATNVADAEIASFEVRDNGYTNVVLDIANKEVTATGDISPIMTLVNGRLVIAEGATEVAGIAALRTALQAQVDADAAVATAQDNLTDAQADLTEVEQQEDFLAEFTNAAEAPLTDADAVIGQLETLETALSDLQDEVARFENARDLNSELLSLDAAVEAANDAIEDLGFDLQEFVDGATAEDGNDVYLFADSVGEDNAITINSFGDEGVDRIFFGPDYKLVQLAEGETIDSRVGSSSELEIFWQQDGDNLVLFVEQAVTSGNATNANEITEITLTGVNAEDISFTSGFLAAGSIA